MNNNTPNDEKYKVSLTPEEVELYYKNQKKRRNIVLDIILVLLVLVIVVTAAYSIKTYVDIKKSKDSEAALAELTTFDASASLNASYGDVVFPDGILDEYKAAYAANQHLVGWIKVPNTLIDQPVVKCENNSAYLKYDFYRKSSARGTIFMDYRNDIKGDDTSLIIYGHNFYDRTMFSDLEKYESLDFYKSSPVVEFNTIYEKKEWKIVSVFITTATASEDNGYVFNYIYPFLQGDNYTQFLAEIKKRSLYNIPVDVNSSDKLLILSTCTRMLDYSGTKADGRCVIVARALRDGEDSSVDASSASVNNSAKYPQIWYTKNKAANPYASDAQWQPIATR